MTSLIIGILCCLGMGGMLHTYLQITKKKYYNNKDQSSLSNTFYHTGWRFRVLLIAMCLLLVYPILLANGYIVDNSWILTAPTTVEAWGKLLFSVCMGGLIGVSFNADFQQKTESTPHVVGAAAIAGGCAFAGCLMRPEWYVGLSVWLAWLIYYLIKQYKNKKAGNPNAFSLYMELVCFYSMPTCLIIFMLMKYLF